MYGSIKHANIFLLLQREMCFDTIPPFSPTRWADGTSEMEALLAGKITYSVLATPNRILTIAAASACKGVLLKENIFRSVSSLHW